MNVSLTPQLEDYVRRKVESGLYNNASEVIRDGLRLLIERDANPQRDFNNTATDHKKQNEGRG